MYQTTVAHVCILNMAILNMDKVGYFVCLFDGFISSDFRFVLSLIVLHSGTHPVQSTSKHVNSDDILLSSMSWLAWYTCIF